jgi:hypothetical protein
MTKWHGGKGSGRRVEDKKKIDANWDAIFSKKKKSSWLDRFLEWSFQRQANKLFKRRKK